MTSYQFPVPRSTSFNFQRVGFPLYKKVHQFMFCHGFAHCSRVETIPTARNISKYMLSGLSVGSCWAHGLGMDRIQNEAVEKLIEYHQFKATTMFECRVGVSCHMLYDIVCVLTVYLRTQRKYPFLRVIAFNTHSCHYGFGSSCCHLGGDATDFSTLMHNVIHLRISQFSGSKRVGTMIPDRTANVCRRLARL